MGGLTYARLLWIPYASWSASFIANIDDGAHTFFNPFYKKYAVKIDYTGFEKYGSVIFPMKNPAMIWWVFCGMVCFRCHAVLRGNQCQNKRPGTI